MINMQGRVFSAWFLILLPLVIPFQAIDNNSSRCEYWVAPSPYGDDANNGSSDMPWATLKYASENVPDDNCTVWFRPGVYQGSSRINRRFETPTTFKSIIPYQAILEDDGGVVIISGGRNIAIEGFDIRQTGPGTRPLVIAIDRSQEGWAEKITLRNNIIHDSYNNDLLKIYNGCKEILVENNLFFNQGDSEEHMDVNSVTDVTIQENIFFNSFETSGRENKNKSKQYIVIKDSNGFDDGLLGSRRIYVRRNVMLNWQGQERETFIQVGLDGKPYFEAVDVFIENNLIIGNSNNQIGAAFGVRGARDVFFTNNTVIGNLPAQSYAFRVTISDKNPKNQNIFFANNIWSDPTGTMGAPLRLGENEFSDGDPEETNNLFLLNNLYWNGGEAIPNGDLVSPLFADNQRIVQDPMLESNLADLVLPIWNGVEFISGSATIHEEFIRLVNLYAKPAESSPVVNAASPDYAPEQDILNRTRPDLSDIGAFELIDQASTKPVKKMKDTRR